MTYPSPTENSRIEGIVQTTYRAVQAAADPRSNELVGEKMENIAVQVKECIIEHQGHIPEKFVQCLYV